MRIDAGVGTRFGEPIFYKPRRIYIYTSSIYIIYIIRRHRFIPVPRILSVHAGYVLVCFGPGVEVVVGTENPAFTHLRKY